MKLLYLQNQEKLSIWLCEDIIILNNTCEDIHIINFQISSMCDKEGIYIKLYTYVTRPVKTNMVSLKIGSQHFILPQTVYSYLEKNYSEFEICNNILVFQYICPPGVFRVFQIFHCFSTYFNSLNFPQSFSEACVNTSLFSNPGYTWFLCSKDLQPEHNTPRAKLCNS